MNESEQASSGEPIVQDQLLVLASDERRERRGETLDFALPGTTAADQAVADLVAQRRRLRRRLDTELGLEQLGASVVVGQRCTDAAGSGERDDDLPMSDLVPRLDPEHVARMAVADIPIL